VADRESGLQILNVSDPSSPALLGSYDTPDEAYSVYVENTTAYVVAGTAGVLILNVSDPANPTPIATCDSNWPAHGAAVRGETLYIVSGGKGLRLLDVSTLTNPVVLGTYERPSEVFDVWMEDNATHGYLTSRHKLWVMDMTDPFLPVSTGSCALSSENWNNTNRLFVKDNLAYVAVDDYGLDMINVTDPSNPTLVGEYVPTGGFGIHDVYVVGQYAYVLADQLRIVDVSSPAAPSEMGAFDTPGDARRLCVADSIAYVADGEAGLRLIDVSDPANLVELSHIDPPEGFAANAVDVDTSSPGNFRLYAASTSGLGSWLQCFDVSDLGSPSLLAEHYVEGSVLNDLDVYGNYVYAGGSIYIYSREELDQLLEWLGPWVLSVREFQSQAQMDATIVIITLHSFGSLILRLTTPPGELVRIEVTPEVANLRIGDQQQFSARGFDAYNNEVPIDPIWSTNGGTITASGVYTATTVGDFTVTASVEGSPFTGTASVHVTPGSLDRIEVIPSVANLRMGDQQQFSAEGFDAYNNEMPIDPIWSTDCGTITSEGLYTAPLTEGDYTVTAGVESSEITGTADVHVGSCMLPGDVNEDDMVNILDALFTVNYILELNPEPFNPICADCKVDGSINVMDVLGIINVVLGIGECGP